MPCIRCDEDDTGSRSGATKGHSQTAPKQKGKKPPREPSRTLAKAQRPLLQWGPSADERTKARGPMTLLGPVRPKAVFRVDGTDALVCILFTMIGVPGCPRGDKCKYAHLDGQGETRDIERYASLRKFIEDSEIHDTIVFSPEGKRLAGSPT